MTFSMFFPGGDLRDLLVCMFFCCCFSFCGQNVMVICLRGGKSLHKKFTQKMFNSEMILLKMVDADS